jgi:hypothetical protein
MKIVVATNARTRWLIANSVGLFQEEQGVARQLHAPQPPIGIFPFKRLFAASAPTAPRPEGHCIECPHPIGFYCDYSRGPPRFVRIAMCYSGIKAGDRIKNAIIVEIPAISHCLVWLNCRGQGYPDDVSIDAILAHDKGINRQCLCCRRCHRTQHESESRHPDTLKPSILFHNLSCSFLVILKLEVS